MNNKTIKAYHERSKHNPYRHADSPDYMDWENQPVPFREFMGAPQISLPLRDDGDHPYSALYGVDTATPAEPVSMKTVARVLELSLGLSAWKSYQGSTWALRMNPSSGNLHPTECYLILPKLKDHPPCVAHYNPYLHVLEQRAVLDDQRATQLSEMGGFGIILTSIPWREAWKYGERAFRYCQHDLGHALGAVRFACHLNQWKMKIHHQVSNETLAHFLGFDRIVWPKGTNESEEKRETEYADCLCWVEGANATPEQIRKWFASSKPSLKPPIYEHQPNQLSARHENWSVIDDVYKSIQGQMIDSLPNFDAKAQTENGQDKLLPLVTPVVSSYAAEAIISNRRSAQSFDRGRSVTDQATFVHTLQQTLVTNGCPFDLFPFETNVHLAVFVHSVDGLAPGLYMFVRNATHLQALKDATDDSFVWQQVTQKIPLYLLQPGNFRDVAQSISCGQDIAGDSAYSLGMIARFDSVLQNNPLLYPTLYWETGLVGQVLYLEAEAHNLRGTGIGCFYDDVMHKMLGLETRDWQSLYHFTVGVPTEDTRLQTRPPYYHLK